MYVHRVSEFWFKASLIDLYSQRSHVLDVLMAVTVDLTISKAEPFNSRPSPCFYSLPGSKSDKQHNATAAYFLNLRHCHFTLGTHIVQSVNFLAPFVHPRVRLDSKMRCGRTLCWSVAISRQLNAIQHTVTQCEIHFLIEQLSSVAGSAAYRDSRQVTFALCETIQMQLDIRLWNLIAKYIDHLLSFLRNPLPQWIVYIVLIGEVFLHFLRKKNPSDPPLHTQAEQQRIAACMGSARLNAELSSVLII